MPDPTDRGEELSFVGDVTRERDGALQLARERLDPLRIAREHRDSVALGEAPRERRTSARAEPVIRHTSFESFEPSGSTESKVTDGDVGERSPSD